MPDLLHFAKLSGFLTGSLDSAVEAVERLASSLAAQLDSYCSRLFMSGDVGREDASR